MTVCDLEIYLESLHLEGCNYNICYRTPDGVLHDVDVVSMSKNSENIILE